MSRLKFRLKKRSDSEQDYLIIRNQERRIEADLRLYRIEDHGHYIQYVPSLNLSAYGETPEEAIEMIKEVIHDYCDQLVKLKPRLQAAELAKYGFKQEKWKKKKFTSQVHVDKEGVLRNFELPTNTPIEETSILV